jgi:hypothetical protein
MRAMRETTRARLRSSILAAVGAIVVASAATALARPGGGGSYHGGGGGGGGGGFGGGGGGFHVGGGGLGGGSTLSGPGLFFFLLVAIVFVVLFVVQAQRRRAAEADGAADEVSPPRPVDPLSVLRARDPGLTEESIVDHVRQMADMLRTAWCSGDMRAARAFVSDGVFSRFQVQLGLMQGENRRNVMGDARVLSVTIEAAENADPLDVVHVRVAGEARDTEVPCTATDEQIRAALSRVSVEGYSEIWSISRCSGAQSKPAGYQVGRACPSCGAPLTEGESIKCRYCGALVCSGEHDWVLAEITQVVEWHPTGRPVRGLDELCRRDPGAARGVLEDRASYLFWKWVQAGRMGGPAPLRKCAAPSFLAAGAELGGTRGASDVAIGGADVVDCELGEPSGQALDHVWVEVAWSARYNGAHAYTPSKTVLRLARRSGVVSKPSMTALVCNACGAPLVESDSTRCDHCGAELAAGDQAWVLDAIRRPG